MPAEYRINLNAGERLACEWHAVEHYREMVAPPSASLLDRVTQASAEADRMTDEDIDREHEFWRQRFLANGNSDVVVPERRKSDL